MPKEDPFQIKMRAEQLRTEKININIQERKIIEQILFLILIILTGKKQARYELYEIWKG